MNFVKPISSLLLLASVVGSAITPLQAKTRADYGMNQLEFVIESDLESALKLAEKLPIEEQLRLLEMLVKQYSSEVNRWWHWTSPKKLMTVLAKVGKGLHKQELREGLILTSLSTLFFATLAGVSAYTGMAALNQGRTPTNDTAQKVGMLLCVGSSYMTLFSILGFGAILIRDWAGNAFHKMPDLDVNSLSFLKLRDLRQNIAKEFTDGLKRKWLYGHRMYADRCSLGLAAEKAYSRKQLQIAAISGAVVLGALLVYLAVSSVRKNTKAKAATIGAGVLGGIAGLLSLSPLATPFVNEKLKRLQSKYREARAQVRAANN